MQKINSAIFSAFIYCLSCTLVFSQSAALLPMAIQQFLDANGNPLSGGSVTFYYPSTFNLKPIWQDSAESVVYANPLTLNAAGEPPSATGIYGQGPYRQIVKDVLGNTTPVIGMCSYGEIGPFETLNNIKNVYLHNESILIMAIS